MTTKANRGPAAAAGNRAALLDAAREIFAEQGARAPLSAIARRAGVGQAVLYRHFPTRESLAHTVFDQNMSAVETLAAQPHARLRDVTDLITHQIEGTAAVIGLFAGDEESPYQRELLRRMRVALRPVLERAVEAGEVDAAVTIEDLVTAVGMVTALLTRTPPGRQQDRAEAAWSLLMRGLSPRR